MRKLGLPSFLKSYELLINRTYDTEEAVSHVIEQLDNLMKSHGYEKVDVMDGYVNKCGVPSLADDLRLIGVQEFEYRSPLGRKIRLEKTVQQGEQVLSVYAKWSIFPVNKKLRRSIRKINTILKGSDISSIEQKISEFTSHNVLRPSF